MGSSNGEEGESGTEIGGVRLVRLLGAGAGGEVHLAQDDRLDRPVAIKLLHNGASEEVRLRFMREARMTARCAHPNIVAIHDVGEHHGRPFIVLEYVEGDSLSQVMRQGPVHQGRALRWLGAVADALAAAHEQGVIHRDLKPGNILIGDDGRLRVADFGIATATGQEDVERAGTPGYIAPEVWRGDSSTSAVDMWAFGVLAYEMLVGRRPFHECEHDLTALSMMVQSAQPAPRLPEALAVPEHVARLVDRCLDKDPDQRPTASALAAAWRESQAVDATTAIPFRGLTAFGEDDASQFHGREDDVARFLLWQREHALIPVVGPSGVGKSSFVRAGALPAWRRQMALTVLEFRPGDTPLASLERCVSQTVSVSAPSAEGTWLGDQAWDDDDAVASETDLKGRLARFAEESRSTIVLLIDQAEELFTTTCNDAGDFFDQLADLTEGLETSLRVVLTLRSDFAGQFLASWTGRRPPVFFVLRALSAADIADVLDKTIRGSDYTVDDPRLLQDMAEEVGGEPSSLPLLQQAGQLLWAARDTDARQLKYDTYLAFGGVRGAISSHAEQVLASLDETRRSSTERLFVRLAHSDGTRRSVAPAVAAAGLEHGETLVQVWVDARLLTVRQTADGTVLEIAHEALVEAWPRLSEWVHGVDVEQRMRETLQEAARLWEEMERSPGLLWDHDAMARAELLLSPEELDIADAFVGATRTALAAKERRSQTRRQWVVGGALLVALVAILTALAFRDASQRASSAAEASDQSRAQAVALLARQAYDDGDLFQARAQLRASLDAGDSLEARTLWSTLRGDPRRWRMEVTRTIGRIAQAGKDHIVVISGEQGSVERVHLTTREREPLVGMETGSAALAYVESTGQVWAADAHGGVFVWQRDESTATRRATLDERVRLLVDAGEGWVAGLDWPTAQGGNLVAWHGESQQLFEVAPDIFAIAASHLPGHVWLLHYRSRLVEHRRLEDFALVASWPLPDIRGSRLAASPDGRHVAVLGREHAVLFDVDGTERQRWSSSGLPADVLWVDDQTVLGINDTGMVRRYSVAGPQSTWYRLPAEEENPVTRVALAGPERLLIGRLGSVDLLDLTVSASSSGTHASPLVGEVEFDRQSNLFTAGEDGTVVQWDVERGVPRTRLLDGDDPVYRMHVGEQGVLAGNRDLWMFGRDGSRQMRVAVAADEIGLAFLDGDVLVAHGNVVERWRPTGGLNAQRVWTVSFDTSARHLDLHDSTVVVALNDGSVRWFRADGAGMHALDTVTLPSPPARWVVLSPDGTEALAASWDDKVWRVRPGAEPALLLDGAVGYGHFKWASDGTILVPRWTGWTEIDPTGHRVDHELGEVVYSLARDVEHKRTAVTLNSWELLVWDDQRGSFLWEPRAWLPHTGGMLTHTGWTGTSTLSAEDLAMARAGHGGVGSLDGGLFCTYDREGQLHAGGSTYPGQRSARLVPVEGGCVEVGPKGVRAYDGASVTVLDEQSATILSLRPAVVAIDGEAHRVDATALEAVGPVPPLGTAWHHGSWGRRDGTLLVDGMSVSLAGAPRSPVTHLSSAPGDAFAVAFADGTYGLWTRSGQQLRSERLQGPIVVLDLREDALLAMSRGGQIGSMDLGVFLQDPCALHREVAAASPMTWGANGPQRAEGEASCVEGGAAATP